MKVEWAREVRDQCISAGVPFFFKQWGGFRPKSGGRDLDGRAWDEFPNIVKTTYQTAAGKRAVVGEKRAHEVARVL
jgi:hypothetical protein